MNIITIGIEEAENRVLLHTTKTNIGLITKGTKLSPQDISALMQSSYKEIQVLSLPEDALDENEAAQILTTYLENKFRYSLRHGGRINFYAKTSGFLKINKQHVDGFNALSPRLTLATVQPDIRVGGEELLATLKIIPFSVEKDLIKQASNYLKNHEVLEVFPFIPHDVILFSTQTSAIKQQVLDKTAVTLKAKLLSFQSSLVNEIRIPHECEILSEKLETEVKKISQTKRLFVIYGASSVMDDNDVIPAAICKAGGEVIRIGMPVEPGNLLVLGKIGDVTVVGAPGCSRGGGHKNGLDMVLNYILSGNALSSDAIGAMGVGGLLYEKRAKIHIVNHKKPQDIKVSAIVLAAGKSSRMRNIDQHKLLARIGGETLIHKVVAVAYSSACSGVKVVTGHKKQAIEEALVDLKPEFLFNEAYESGMASSIVAGVQAFESKDADGILILLGDMPAISSFMINKMIEAFQHNEGKMIIRAVHHGKRGNPVILPMSMKSELLKLQGDIGARAIIEQSGLDVVDVEIGEAARIDLDTPEMMHDFGAVF